jgi:hypothetical protein
MILHFMYDWETYQSAYQNARPEQKAVVDSEVVSACVHKVIAEKQLDDSHYSKLVRLFALSILGALAEQTMLAEMKNIGIPDGVTVFDSLKICLAAPPTATQPTTEPDLSSDIAETEAALSALPSHMRTMSQDMAEAKATEGEGEKVYSSTQSAILNEGQKKAETATPRWESDS